MELPSLAVGIGLQGKPIDRAQLNYLREKGAEEAKVKKAAVKDKELEGYKKQMLDISGTALFPYQKVIMANKQAEAYKYLADNINDLDQGQIGAKLAEIKNLSAQFKSDYNSIQKLQFQGGSKALPFTKSIDALKSVDDVETLNQILKNDPVANWSVDENNYGFKGTAFDYVPITESVKTNIDKNFDSYLEPMEAGVGIGTLGSKGNEYANLRLKPQAYSLALTVIRQNPELSGSASFDYSQSDQYKKSKYDLSTVDGVNNYYKDRDTWVVDNIIKPEFDARTKSRGLPQVSDTNITVNTGDKTLQPGGTYATRIIAKYNNGEFEVQSPWTKSMGDERMTIQPNVTLFRSDGQPVNPTDYKDVTYNTTGVNYTLDKDYTLKNTFITTDRNGKKIEFKKGQVFKKGSLVPAGAEEDIAKEGAEFSAKPIAFGQAADGTWYYQQSAGTLQSRMAGANTTDKKDYQKGYDKQTEMQRQVNEWRKQRNAAGTPGYKGAPAAAKTTSKSVAGSTDLKKKTDKRIPEVKRKDFDGLLNAPTQPAKK